MNERREVERLLQKIIKKAKDGDAYYHYGVEYSSDKEKPDFKAYIGWSKEGVQPLMFGENTRAKLVKELKHYLANESRIHATVRYHESLIKANQDAIAFHKDWITKYREALDEAVHSEE